MRATFTLFPEEITANKVPNGDRTWANLDEASEAYDCERYIRADVHEAEIERLNKALKQAKERAQLIAEDEATQAVLLQGKYELNQPLVVYNARTEFAELNAWLKENA